MNKRTEQDERERFEATLPKHDHAFFDPEGEQPDILVWNKDSMWKLWQAALSKASNRETDRSISWIRAVRALARELGLADEDSKGGIADWKFIKKKALSGNSVAVKEPCPDKDRTEYACENRHQCWEPCGELGKSEEHAIKHRPITSQEGWKLIPIEPTPEMLSCISIADIEWHGRRECYASMLSAAPTLDKEE